ncbi:hypothetical protein CLAIMM_06275 [Cladophialophora immunda]|nr:hypothetical protein CLAIMM_06275 [Cladophialophora immunda]
MAEAFGLAASVFSVAGLAGQLAQGSAFLYNFFKDIRNAPADVRSLCNELRIISSTLTTIHQSYDIQDADLEQALRRCEQIINGLSTMIKSITPADELPEWKKIRQRFIAALNRSESAKHLRALERAKSMLLQCCTNNMRKSQSAQACIAVDTHNVVLDAQKTAIDTMSTVIDTHRAVVETRNTTIGTERTILDTQRIVGEIRAGTSSICESSVQIREITSETRTLVNRFADDTSHMRNVTERIEAASRELLGKPQDIAPELLQAFTKEVPRIISRTVCRRLEKMLREQVDQGSGKGPHIINPGECSTARLRDGIPDERPSASLRPSSTEKLPDHPADHWVLKSSISTSRHLISNSFLGSLTIRTTVKSYSRKRSDGSGRDEKEERQTTVTFLPATWLMSKGAVLAYNTWKRIGGGAHQSPIYSLKTVNIVPSDSKIIQACVSCDLTSIRTLFDSGQASPFDVGPGGTNLLVYVATSPIIQGVDSFMGQHSLPRSQASETKSEIGELLEMMHIVNLLTSLGVDAGDRDLNNLNALTMLCVAWPASTKLDKFSFLLDKLLLEAKTDPFSSNNPLLPCYHPTPVEVLIRQKEWRLQWTPLQFLALFDFGLIHDLIDVPSPTRSFVEFWTVTPDAAIEAYLQAKLSVVQIFLAHDTFPVQKFTSLGEEAIQRLIHHGGDVIALLSEHDDDGNDPPCLHRVRKLVLVSTFMITALGLLLEFWCPYLATKDQHDEISLHAQQHNMRTINIWRKALEKACGNAQDAQSNKPPSNHDTGISGCASVERRDEVNSFDEDGWETEASDGPTSGWETEEEWEEGYLLDTAVDIGDRNATTTLPARLKRCTRCRVASNCAAIWEDRDTAGLNLPFPLRLATDRGFQINGRAVPRFDYDEDYWQHVYARFGSEESDRCLYEPATGQVLETLAKASDSFILASKGR